MTVLSGPALPVLPGWFRIEPVDHALTLIDEPYVHEFLRANIWLPRGTGRDLLVDCGLGVASPGPHWPAPSHPVPSQPPPAHPAPSRPTPSRLTPSHLTPSCSIVRACAGCATCPFAWSALGTGPASGRPGCTPSSTAT